MQTKCPACEKTFTVPDEYLGRQCKCSNCKKPFIATDTNCQHIKAPIAEPTQEPKPSVSSLMKKQSNLEPSMQFSGALFLIISAGAYVCGTGNYGSDPMLSPCCFIVGSAFLICGFLMFLFCGLYRRLECIRCNNCHQLTNPDGAKNLANGHFICYNCQMILKKKTLKSGV